MKVGFGFLIWTTYVAEEHLPHLATIKAAGYDGVEVPLFEGDAGTLPPPRGADRRRGAQRPPASG